MAEESRVQVRPMTAAEFEPWAARSVASFADDLAAATGRPRAAAAGRARAVFDEQLPAGRETPGTWLLTVLDGDDPVGTLWLGQHPNRKGAGFVWDLEIAEAHRGRGLGRAAMLAGEELLRKAGFTEIGLNVFGFNQPARRLYETLGYGVVVTEMVKRLDDDPVTGS